MAHLVIATDPTTGVLTSCNLVDGDTSINLLPGFGGMLPNFAGWAPGGPLHAQIGFPVILNGISTEIENTDEGGISAASKLTFTTATDGSSFSMSLTGADGTSLTDLGDGSQGWGFALSYDANNNFLFPQFSFAAASVPVDPMTGNIS